jgi:hypothetical protein
VKRTPPLQDRRSKRDLQDTAQKLIELSVSVAAKNFSGHAPISSEIPPNPLTETPTPEIDENFVVLTKSEGKRNIVSIKV